MRQVTNKFVLAFMIFATMVLNADEKFTEQERKERYQMGQVGKFIKDCVFEKDSNACQIAIAQFAELGYSPDKCNKGEFWADFCFMIAATYGQAGNYFMKHKYNEVLCHIRQIPDQCSEAGFNYFGGKGVRQDYGLAKQYHGKACDLGDQVSCDIYRKMNEAGVR